MPDQESKYIVSSLKYRPQTFEDVVGQEHVSRTLRNALQRQRLANGYIFTGPRGVGKTTSARILAKAINCENPNDGNPCNECNHCIEITSGRSLDVFEVDGASTRGIDAIRELREVVKYPPANSNYRVYIIDEVHMLTKEAFNALLKTLEEPPPQVLFIFATTEPQKVPLTILSRCQRYDFRMISTETMVARLKMISEREGISISNDGLALIARKAAGSLRDSLSLLDQVSAFAEDEASLELVRRVLGVLDVTIYFDIIHHIASQSSENVITQSNLLFSRGISITEFLQGLSDHIRNLLVVKVAGITSFLDVADSDVAAYEEQAGYFEERDLIRMQTLVLETLRDQRFVSNQIVSVELMLLKLARSTRALDLDAVLNGTTLPLSRDIPKPKPVKLPEPEKITQTAKPKIKPVPSKPDTQEQTPQIKPVEEAASTPLPQVEEKTEKSQVTPALVVHSEPAENISKHTAPASDSTGLEGTKPDETISLETIVKGWDTFVERLGKAGRSTSAFMSEGSPTVFEQGCLTIAFAPEQRYHIQTLNKTINTIQDIASELFRTRMVIKLVEQNGHKPKERKEDELLAHPTSQHLLDIFDGEIIDD
ncbi:MAG: DNA polymerase III subunit gamma/tau [Candidatus Marinimicrobia bacterium]|nr:DNA polymerase III subunit gamma/tau [Candidatus Neomarinimicrobiota bacterium]